MLELHVRLRRSDGADCLQRAGDAVVNLFNWAWVLDRDNPRGVPFNANSRLHFALCGQRCGVNRNIQLGAAAFHMQHQLIFWMLVDVFQQCDRIVDGRLIEPADNVSGTQAGRGCRRRIRLDFSDDWGFCRINEQLSDALPAPSARLRLIRLYPYGSRRSISLKFHSDLFAFAPHHVPADAVCHLIKTSNWLTVYRQDFFAELQPYLTRRRTER